jgi:hypothetical protein
MPPKKTTAVWAKQANDEGLAKLSSFFKAVPKQGSLTLLATCVPRADLPTRLTVSGG